MSSFWQAQDESRESGPRAPLGPEQTGGSVRKEQITIRLDPGMITDARAIAARKGIGHHTLLRMWVMEGITRAYQEGLLDGPPQSWTPPARRAATHPAPALTPGTDPAPPAGARWARLGRRAKGQDER